MGASHPFRARRHADCRRGWRRSRIVALTLPMTRTRCPLREKTRVVTPLEEVNRRYAQIASLVDDSESLLKRSDLDARVKAFARRSRPELNEARTLLWFVAYICFGRDKWVLLPSRHRCGRKTIQAKGPGSSAGRPPSGAGFAGLV